MSRRWIVIDAETDPFLHGRLPEAFAWGAYDGRCAETWWDDTEGFAEWLCGQDVIAYAHNAGRFDAFHLLDYIDTSKPIRLINGRIASVFIGRCELRDSWLLLPVALSNKLADYSIMEATERGAHRDVIERYLRGDLLELYAKVAAFHAEHPGLPLTLAGAAFRRMLEVCGLPRPEGSESYDQIFRPYYFGGRCQALRKGTKNARFQSYDIKSAYPAAMRESHPWGHRLIRTARFPDVPSGAWFARIHATSRGALPLRMRDRLEYPTEGAHTFSATGWEILAGLETRTLEVHDVYEVWEPMEVADFRPFVDRYYAEKEHAPDEESRLCAKVTLNAPYGKLAQDPSRYHDYFFSDEPNGDVVYRLGPHWVSGEPAKRHTRYDVATAASITGYVRAKLWRAMVSVGIDDVLYCDTDSLAFLTRRNGQNLDVGGAIGQWEREGSYDRYAIGGRKLYAFREANSGKWRVRSKGCRLTAEEIIRVARGETVEWSNQAPTYSISRGVHFQKREIKRT